MSFKYIITPDDIREKMFNFIKPEYKGTLDMEYGGINWIYGIFDSETGLFIAHVRYFDYTNAKIRYVIRA